MPDDFDQWYQQYMQEHNGQEPTYGEYQQHQMRLNNPGMSAEQAYYNYWGGQNQTDSGSSTPATPVPLPEVKTWDQWVQVYGSQPGKVDDMHDAMKAMQTGSGAQSLWGKFVDVAMPNATDYMKKRLSDRFYTEYAKYEDESGRAALSGAAPIGWHNYLTTKAPEGLTKDWAYMAPEDRGETPWNYSTKQRVQWR